MVLNKDSGLVKVWVSLIKEGKYTLEQVPKLSNLKEVVTECISS